METELEVELDKQASPLERLEDVSNLLGDISAKLLKQLKDSKASKPSPAGTLPEKDFSAPLMEEMARIARSIDTLRNQVNQRREVVCQKPPGGSFSRKALYLCLGVSVISSLLTAFSLHFLTQRNRYELGSKEILTCRKGSMLEKAWPKLTPKEREKITGIPPAPSKPTRH